MILCTKNVFELGVTSEGGGSLNTIILKEVSTGTSDFSYRAGGNKKANGIKMLIAACLVSQYKVSSLNGVIATSLTVILQLIARNNVGMTDKLGVEKF